MKKLDIILEKLEFDMNYSKVFDELELNYDALAQEVVHMAKLVDEG